MGVTGIDGDGSKFHTIRIKCIDTTYFLYCGGNVEIDGPVAHALATQGITAYLRDGVAVSISLNLGRDGESGLATAIMPAFQCYITSLELAKSIVSPSTTVCNILEDLTGTALMSVSATLWVFEPHPATITATAGIVRKCFIDRFIGLVFISTAKLTIIGNSPKIIFPRRAYLPQAALHSGHVATH